MIADRRSSIVLWDGGARSVLKGETTHRRFHSRPGARVPGNGSTALTPVAAVVLLVLLNLSATTDRMIFGVLAPVIQPAFGLSLRVLSQP